MTRWKGLALLCAIALSSCSLASKPEDIFKIVSFNDVSVVLGRPATLVCYADFIVTGIDVQYTIVKDGDSSYLPTQIAMNRATMMKVGEEVWVTFSQAVKADEGTYTCTATVNHNAAYSGFTEPSQQAMLNVDDTQLVFLEDPDGDTFYVAPGGDITIDICTTNQMSVTWTLEKDGAAFADSSYTFDSRGVLTVSDYNVLDSRATSLVCLAQWNGGTINRTFAVSIDGAPKLRSRPGFVYFYNITADGTTEHFIECNMALPYSQLDQYTTYTWYYPATSQQSISRTVSSNSPYVDGRNRLVFTDANPTHSGQYRCTGVNAFGSNSTYSNVTIINPAPVFWVQYWMIIIYVVIGLAILILVIALCIRFCCLGFCYVKEKKVVVDSTFYTTTKFDDEEEKIPLQDKTEFQEVEVDMQLAGIQGEESDEDYDLPPEVDVRPPDMKAKYPWDDEEEAAQLHRTEGRQLVRALKQTERPRRQREEEAFVEVHPRRRPRKPRQPEVAQIEVQPEPEPQPVIATPESQRKVDITQEQEIEVSPYDIGPTVQQRMVTKPKVVQQAKVSVNREITEAFKVIEDTDPLIEEDRMSGESQVFEATFGMSDLESEEPPDSDFNL
jgi:hypothetical protein